MEANIKKLPAPAYSKSNLKEDATPSICIVGAGNLCCCSNSEKLGIKSFTLFERNEDVGGTWLVNTYPGCACDVQSHLYSLSFEQNPDWSENYSSQPEIWAYMQKVAKKYDIYPHVKFNTEVKTLVWDEDMKKWKVTYVVNSSLNQEEKESTFDFVINGCGGLREPHIPEQFLSFKGPCMHSAQWDSSVVIDKTKTVAVIGSGASAIQIIPAIVDKVKELHLYQRKPAWVMPRTQFEFPAAVKWIFANIPLVMWLFRCLIFISNELVVSAFYKDSILSRAARKLGRYHRNSQIPNNRKLADDLTPKYAFGCKRVVISQDYYPALSKLNATVHTAHIDKVTENSIITKDGYEQKIDVLILATGFRVQDYFLPMQIYGKGGANIYSLLKSTPWGHYKGIVSSYLPNFFFLLGPNTGLGHNTAIFQIEAQVEFTLAVIKEMIRRKAKSIAVKPSVEEKFMDRLNRNMKKTVWGTSDCGSWYADENGEINTLWPQSSTAYLMETRKVDFTEYDFE